MIDSTNIAYDKWLPVWAKCRHAISGQESVHEAGRAYLPELSGQDAKSYEAYNKRALYVNLSGRTLDGMTGMIFRKAPALEAPDAFETYTQDVDLCGSTLTNFAEMCVDELCKVSRYGILVDYPAVQTVGLTMGQAQAAGLRPYLTLYKTESILDWRYSRIDNAQTLTLVKLHEVIEVETGEYTWEQVDQIRILELVEGVYRIRLYRKGSDSKSKSAYELYSESFPMMNNAPMRFIPFIFDSPFGVDSDISKPVLLDLVNVNLSHYRSMADYEHGLHFTGLPTATFWGARDDELDSVHLGSSTALAFSDPSGHAEYLEFTGQGLTQLRDAIKDKQDMMAALGSKMLASEKRVTEAAETAMIHRSAEHSVLASLSYSASAAIQKALRLMAEWARINPEQITYSLNTDFAPAGMDANLFRELTNAYLSGAMSYDEYFYNLKEGELIRGETTLEEEQERIQNQGLNLSGDGE
jgi:hypothetical protein